MPIASFDVIEPAIDLRPANCAMSPRAFSDVIESDRSISMTDVARTGPLASALLAAACLAAACGRDVSQSPAAARISQSDRQSVLDRGRYLVDTVALCNDCHTPRNTDGSSAKANGSLAGVECLTDTDPEPGKGCLNSRNLTPDATGLKSRTDVQIKAMFLDGVTPTGKALIPIMPYFLYHNMNDAD